jgi:hypothetical protein
MKEKTKEPIPEPYEGPEDNSVEMYFGDIIEMTLSNKQLANQVIEAMFRYIGAGFMCDDNTGKTVDQIIRRYETQKAETIISKIALMTLGANLPGQKSKIRQMKFIR